MTDFRRLLDALVAGQVEFVIVGGLASTAHGSARLTQDIDIVYSRTPTNLERLIAALAPYRPYLRDAPQGLPFLWDAATLQRGLNFTLTTLIGDIDLLGEIAGARLEAAGTRADGSALMKIPADLVCQRIHDASTEGFGMNALCGTNRRRRALALWDESGQ